MPRSAVVLGGSSELAVAILRRLAPDLETVLLAGRNETALTTAQTELSLLGIPHPLTASFDVTSVAGHEDFADEARRRVGEIDLVLVSAGLLGTADLGELDAGRVAESLATNCTGPAAAMTAFARVLRAQGRGRIVVLSSVAGVRVRRANFVYGAGKAGLDAFAVGLGYALAGSGVGVTVVRPGFVPTRMTEGMRVRPLSASADAVGWAVAQAVAKGQDEVWIPPVLRPLFAALRFVPRRLWRKLPS